MIRVSFDIKCHNGQYTIKPKIYCKGLSTKDEDNISELLASLYATGLSSNIEKAGNKLTDEIGGQLKLVPNFSKLGALRELVRSHGLDFSDIYRDTGEPLRG